MSDALFDYNEKPTTCPHCGRRLVDNTCGWCQPDYRAGRHRRNDQPTSVAGARSVVYRAGSQKALLSAAFEAAWPNDLTDEEAAMNAGVSLTSEYSKRCGELRQDGVIEQVEGRTRMGGAGIPRLVSVFVKDRTLESHARSSHVGSVSHVHACSDTRPRYTCNACLAEAGRQGFPS